MIEGPERIRLARGPRGGWILPLGFDDPNMKGGELYIRGDLVPDWRPIETAPRNKVHPVRILVCREPEGFVEVDRVYWSAQSHEWIYPFRARLWMPMPAPSREERGRRWVFDSLEDADEHEFPLHATIGVWSHSAGMLFYRLMEAEDGQRFWRLTP